MEEKTSKVKDNKKTYLRETSWQKGQPSPNPSGRPRTGKGKPVSKLRSTLARLREIEPMAIENIKKSVNGDTDIDKEVLANSRWVVSTSVTVLKAAMQEELAIHGIREKNAELADEVENEQSSEPSVVFSLNMLPEPKDLQ